ncbi:beta-galactosidase [Algoriphagus aestuarii]|nr:beta-galactosidase [Algoriphagus aestuarii]
MRFLSAVSAILIQLYFLSFNSILAQSENSYRRIYLSGKDAGNPVKWDFKVSQGRNSGNWTQIAVPSNWEMQGFGVLNYGHDHRDSNKTLGTETGYYKTTFFVEREWKDAVVKLVFDGVMTDTEVKINGKLAGKIHQGGFYRFSYDISKLLDFDKVNILEVKVNKISDNQSVNKAEREADFWIFGGIYRPVFLEILPKIHFTRIAVDPKANGDFRALVTLNKTPKDGIVEMELMEIESGKSLEKIQQNIDSDSIWMTHSFANIKPWNPENPIRYRAVFRLKDKDAILYERSENLGFRTVELRPKVGVFINGVKTIFKGVNRHSFYPTTGRALSFANQLEDILLMKEMNMNAVRMSHYPPDEVFLNLADSLGLFVLDEVTGWQDGYDSEIGPKLIQETILRDANHPAIIFWDHGNEGGWNFENEPAFNRIDIQKRPVIYPWLNRNNIDTYHYPTIVSPADRLDNGDDIFMPTELLHGLYDGGLGAGLDDFWSNYRESPLFAGGFLWVFSDEAVKRVDKGGKLDSDGNHAPDGILGPFREKEGSFYSIKSIWSPIQIELPEDLTNYDGSILVRNDYLFSDMSRAKLQVELIQVQNWEGEKVIGSEVLTLGQTTPGNTELVNFSIPENWPDADILKINVIGIHGDLLTTWTFPLRQAAQANKHYFNASEIEIYPIKVRESVSDLQIEVDGRIYFFGKKYGNLEMVKVGRKYVYLSQNPKIEGHGEQQVKVTWKKIQDGSIQVKSVYENYPKELIWTVLPTSELKLEMSTPYSSQSDLELLGIGFNYPDSLVKGAKLIADGPYRVWKNRREGSYFGFWEKEYNDTQTGFSFDNLVYPEFKGYYSNFHAVNILTTETEIDIRTETPGLFLSLFKPKFPESSTPGVRPKQTDSEISFVYDIPAIGTKFHAGKEMMSEIKKPMPVLKPIVLWFRFR